MIEADLSSLLLSTLSQIQKVPKEHKIKTFDSIPYREIREGLFHNYMDYVEHAPSNCLFPDGFDVVEERLESVTETKFRHYALSLNESLFPEIEGFRIPWIEDRNYLLNLKSNFFKRMVLPVLIGYSSIPLFQYPTHIMTTTPYIQRLHN